MDHKLYSIQGTIFQLRSGEPVETHPTFYSGHFVLNPDGKICEKTGQMIDKFGSSVILEGFMDKDEFRFLKKYLRGHYSKQSYKNVIEFKFKKEGNLWVGSFEGNLNIGEDTNSGESKCITSLVEGFKPIGIWFGADDRHYIRSVEEYKEYHSDCVMKSINEHIQD